MLRARSVSSSAKADDPAMTAKIGSKSNGASAPAMPARLCGVTFPLAAVLVAFLVAFLADALNRDHPLAFRSVEHDHALGRAPGDADAFDARADELAAIGDQHELV